MNLQEHDVVVLGVAGRMMPRFRDTAGRWSTQVIECVRVYRHNDTPSKLVVRLRFDDSCKNGHETFSITGAEYWKHPQWKTWQDGSSGCLPELIVKHFPEFAPLIPWHLTSTDGPMHYPANVLYFAGDRDHHGLRKGERRQIRNGRTGELSWELRIEETDEPLHKLPKYADGPNPPDVTPKLVWRPWWIIGEGKPREFDAARRTAIWPDATDEQLSQEPAKLKADLLARLPALMEQFRSLMLQCGFAYPERNEP